MHTTPDITDALKAIRALANLHGTHSTPDEEIALQNLQDGRAAFWTSHGYHNQLASRLLGAVNQFGLPAALEQCAEDANPSYIRRAEYLLGTLIPLNRAARIEINLAWEAIGGTADAIRRARRSRPVPMFEVAEVE